MHGRGSYKWPNGDNYIGEYHNGLRNGYGEMIYHSKNEHYKDGGKTVSIMAKDSTGKYVIQGIS